MRILSRLAVLTLVASVFAPAVAADATISVDGQHLAIPVTSPVPLPQQQVGSGGDDDVPCGGGPMGLPPCSVGAVVGPLDVLDDPTDGCAAGETQRIQVNEEVASVHEDAESQGVNAQLSLDDGDVTVAEFLTHTPAVSADADVHVIARLCANSPF